MKLIFATQNRHKQEEVQQLLGDTIEIIMLADLDFFEELPETHLTLRENAEEKAQFIYERFGTNCFAEDTGLEIDSLQGAPGVFSARYAGPEKNASDNIRKVLAEMNEITARHAVFKTVISLVYENQRFIFEGIIRGTITHREQGRSGFGYDPIFIPEGSQRTFAEMNFDEKNKISHRKIAFMKMKTFIQEVIAGGKK